MDKNEILISGFKSRRLYYFERQSQHRTEREERLVRGRVRGRGWGGAEVFTLQPQSLYNRENRHDSIKVKINTSMFASRQTDGRHVCGRVITIGLIISLVISLSDGVTLATRGWGRGNKLHRLLWFLCGSFGDVVCQRLN